MELTGTTAIRQPIEVVWSALNNEEILRQCITGCESLERIDASSLIAKLAVKLGPVRAKFNGKIKLSDVVPLQGYTLAFEGSGGAAGFAKGTSSVSLAASPEGTLVSYTAQASVGGKLGQVGGRMIDATARSMADDFFAAFARVLEAGLPQQAVELAANTSTTSVAPAGSDEVSLSSKPSLPQLPLQPQLAAPQRDLAYLHFGQKFSWFMGGMIAATALLLIGKHCL
jgi:uncharacterized protein